VAAAIKLEDERLWLLIDAVSFDPRREKARLDGTSAVES
jgi:hypothetical protein